MPRLNTNEELWVAVSEAGFIRTPATPGGDTTTDAVLAPGVKVISVVSETGFTSGDLLRLGSGNLLEIGVVASTVAGSITIESNIAFDHLSGVQVVSQERVNLGAISDDGITRESSVERTEIRAATQAGVYATLITNANARISWNMLNHSFENVLWAFGMDEANIHGTGVAGDPFIADINPDLFDELNNITVYFAGSLKDGTTIEIQGWDADFDANVSITYLRGQAVSLPFAADVKHIRYLDPSQV
jgi:hypothetical protein